MSTFDISLLLSSQLLSTSALTELMMQSRVENVMWMAGVMRCDVIGDMFAEFWIVSKLQPTIIICVFTLDDLASQRWVCWCCCWYWCCCCWLTKLRSHLLCMVLSVCDACIVAKQYILAKSCLKKQIRCVVCGTLMLLLFAVDFALCSGLVAIYSESYHLHSEPNCLFTVTEGSEGMINWDCCLDIK